MAGGDVCKEEVRPEILPLFTNLAPMGPLIGEVGGGLLPLMQCSTDGIVSVTL